MILPDSAFVSDPREVVACTLGQVAYGPTWTLQECIKERLVQGKKHGELLPQVLLLLEHPPVYTMGKSGRPTHMLLDADARARHGAEFYQIDRGGDITYHGPGQLVAYFLLDLDRFYRDLHRFMRDLEEIVIRTLAEHGLSSFRVRKRTGVWVGSRGQERKICAFGIRSSRWVTMHGLALNVDPELHYFDHIVPCGIQDRGVTSMARELGTPVRTESVCPQLIRHFADVFGADTRMLGSDESFTFLASTFDTPDLRRSLQPDTPGCP